MSGKSLVLTGATGMVGGGALRLALDSPEVARVTSIGRRGTGIQHPKLAELSHSDFLDFGGAARALAGHDAALFCLGAYTGAVPNDELRRITVDYTLSFARALHAQSPSAAFCLLSGAGADPSGRSRFAFARYKGEAERALLGLGFARVHLLRPGYIYPVSPRQEPSLSYRLFRALYPLARRLYPDVGISSEDLARVMVRVALHGSGGFDRPELENRDLRALARAE